MRNRKSLWLWAMAVTLGALLLVVAFRLDASVHRWQQAHRWRNIAQLSRNVTRATDWPAHIAVGLILAGIAWRRGNQKWTRIFLAMLLSAALAGLVAYGLKVSTGRVRPSVRVEKVWHGPDSRSNYQSFPSGHTAASAGFFAVLFFVSCRIGLLCFVISLFVGFTRIFLGAHYLSDVVAALLLGILAAVVVTQLIIPKIENRKSPIEN